MTRKNIELSRSQSPVSQLSQEADRVKKPTNPTKVDKKGVPIVPLHFNRSQINALRRLIEREKQNKN